MPEMQASVLLSSLMAECGNDCKQKNCKHISLMGWRSSGAKADGKGGRNTSLMLTVESVSSLAHCNY